MHPGAARCRHQDADLSGDANCHAGINGYGNTTIVFTLGDQYLQKSYSFQSEKDVYVEQVRVDNPSWGIVFDVLPLNDDPQYCWFEMKVTNIDTQQSDIYGYGRDKGFEKHQLYPMYITGPYKIEMKGNRVKVDVTMAKRNP